MNAAEYIDTYNTTPDYIDPNGDVYSDEDLERDYCSMLDEVYGSITIGYATLDASEVLREMAPTDYRVGLADHPTHLEWDEWTEDHEWNVTDEDEDEDED